MSPRKQDTYGDLDYTVTVDVYAPSWFDESKLDWSDGTYGPRCVVTTDVCGSVTRGVAYTYDLHIESSWKNGKWLHLLANHKGDADDFAFNPIYAEGILVRDFKYDPLHKEDPQEYQLIAPVLRRYFDHKADAIMASRLPAMDKMRKERAAKELEKARTDLAELEGMV